MLCSLTKGGEGRKRRWHTSMKVRRMWWRVSAREAHTVSPSVPYSVEVGLMIELQHGFPDLLRLQVLCHLGSFSDLLAFVGSNW
ncbi:hypothetical protein LIER_13526 [Lithospermum erythrorhizon]|uniref:Uncharacterized protein n=1 Tax=Lithospermum erythrorhizon TaxID=34254 RepID=A0AAV3PVV8_LITER